MLAGDDNVRGQVGKDRFQVGDGNVADGSVETSYPGRQRAPLPHRANGLGIGAGHVTDPDAAYHRLAGAPAAPGHGLLNSWPGHTG